MRWSLRCHESQRQANQGRPKVRLIIGHSYTSAVPDENVVSSVKRIVLGSVMACKMLQTLIFKAKNAFLEKAGAG
jgi:hypothetical protein